MTGSGASLTTSGAGGGGVWVGTGRVATAGFVAAGFGEFVCGTGFGIGVAVTREPFVLAAMTSGCAAG